MYYITNLSVPDRRLFAFSLQLLGASASIEAMALNGFIWS